jgi:hypothetical protein
MKRVKSTGQAQRFLPSHNGINNLFLLRRNHIQPINIELPGLGVPDVDRHHRCRPPLLRCSRQ